MRSRRMNRQSFRIEGFRALGMVRIKVEGRL